MTTMSKLSPSVTSMIRTDHTKVLAVFHKYHSDSTPRIKHALVDTVCLALEIHAQLEEEIFYPAVAAVDAALVTKNVPEHVEMRRLISSMRNMEPTDAEY